MGRLKNERIIELLRDAHEALMDCASMAPGAYFEPGGEGWTVDQRIQRSEEHTSELQSH